MSGITGILHDVYIRFLIWLGAEPPAGYEHLAPPPTLPGEYTLKPGETLFAAARKFGIPYQRIAQANGIEDYDSLKAGQTLKLPPADWTPADGPLQRLETTPAPPVPDKAVKEPAPILEPEEIEEEEIIDEEELIEDIEPPAEPEWLVSAPSIPEEFFDETELPAPETALASTEEIDWLEAGEAITVTESWFEEEISQIEPPAQTTEDSPVVPSLELEEEIPQIEFLAQTTEDFPVSPSLEEEIPQIETPAQIIEEAQVMAFPDTDAFRYAVQRGDTLNAIARRYGLTVKDLVEANNITDPNRIYPGQKLIIPGYLSPKPEPAPKQPQPPSPPPDAGANFIYTVAGGDTLTSIAKRYNITLRQLIEANNIENPNLIRIGQKLIIPGVFAPPQPPPQPEPQPEPMPEPAPTPGPPPDISPGYEIDPNFPPIGSLAAVRAMYVSYFAIGHPQFRQRMFDLLDTTEFNAVVIDAKGDHGWLSYPTHIALAHEIGAARPTAKDFDNVLAQLKKRGVYTIARIVTFKDSPLAKSHPELAVKTQSGEIWQDQEGLSWSDPFLKPAWDYNLQVAIETAQMGFDEIQFDYIRFPTSSAAGAPHFSQDATAQTRIAAITGFLSTAHGQLKPFGVKIAADTFGYTCWRKDDTIIGQDIDRMGHYLDVLCPMLYPSTFGSGIPGYKNAIAHPYEIVYYSALRAVNRLKLLGCSVRPWIQDFPDYRFDKRVYGRQEIQAQIKGCFDSGSSGFMVWDPHAHYTDGAYAPVKVKAAQREFTR
jgi:LysM repeat protein